MAEAPSKSPSPHVYVAYSHADQKFFEQLQEHITAHRRAGLFDGFDHWKVSAVDRPTGTISESLEKADVMLLLISATFLASPYTFGAELARALEMHESGQIALLPVVVRPCDWDIAPFGGLRALPEGGGAVVSWNHAEEAWASVARSLRTLLAHLAAAQSRPDSDARWAGGTSPGARVPRPARPEKTRPTGLSRQQLWVFDFLDAWDGWPFSVERIVHWGARQPGHEILTSLSEHEIRSALDALVKAGAAESWLAPRSRARVYRAAGR